MDLLKEYLAALGGSATALLIVGFFGKAIIDNWFKKDFKKYDAKLDALLAKEHTKFELLHNTRFATGFEIVSKCNELKQAYDNFAIAEIMGEEMSIIGSLGQVERILDELKKQMADKRPLFTDGFWKLVENLTATAFEGIPRYSNIFVSVEQHADKLNEQIGILSSTFREMLGKGDDKEKSVQE